MNAMEALFQPVPFGETRQSVLEKISTPENAPIWEMFRCIDPDKQHKVLLVGIHRLKLLFPVSSAVHLGTIVFILWPSEGMVWSACRNGRSTYGQKGIAALGHCQQRSWHGSAGLLCPAKRAQC